MVTKWLENNFSKKCSSLIRGAPQIFRGLKKGIDIHGKLIVVNNNINSLEYLKYAINQNAMAIEYSTYIFTFFSEFLFCIDMQSSFINCIQYLQLNKITFGCASGEILIGNLEKSKPLLAGIIISQAISNLKL